MNKYYDPPPVVGIAGPDGSCNMRIQYYASSMQQRTVSCPSGFSPNVDNTLCYRIKPEACPAGNPIQCAGGQKTQAEADFVRVGASPLEFVRYYSSTGFYASPGTERPREVLGARWRHNWQSKVVVEQAASVGQETYAYVMQPDGDYRHFHLSGGDWFGRADKSEALQEVVVGGARVSWTYIAADESIYRFDANGRWLSLEQAGRVTTLSYSDSATPPSIAPKPGLLIRVTDSQGRYLDLRYDAASYLTQVTDSAGGTLSYRYAMQQIANLPPANTGLLRFVDHPGRTTREYLYDEVSHVAAGIPYTDLLTGIVDGWGSAMPPTNTIPAAALGRSGMGRMPTF
ncbi:MAG: RHS repeat protein [Xanthomonadales bacterium]|nr:RHS repeat protein [Xanthomonadales bacterium]